MSNKTIIPNSPIYSDGRKPLQELYETYSKLVGTGWREEIIFHQTGIFNWAIFCLSKLFPDKVPITKYSYSFPIVAYFSKESSLDGIMVGGIHGRESSPPTAFAESIDLLVEYGYSLSLCVIPLANPWGYFYNKRHSPNGKSVGDADYFFGKRRVPASPESYSLLRYLSEQKIEKGTPVLDLHEDLVGELLVPPWVKNLDESGTYFYATGEDIRKNPLVIAVKEILESNGVPFLHTHTTRFKQKCEEGIVYDAADFSVDHFLRHLGCSPVITTEIFLPSPITPSIEDRNQINRQLMKLFLDYCLSLKERTN